MASLLTATEKAGIQSALDDIHDTFARDIYIFVKEASTVPVELNFNPLYGRKADTSQISSNIELTKYTYSARIYYEDKQSEELVDGKAEMNLVASMGK